MPATENTRRANLLTASSAIGDRNENGRRPSRCDRARLPRDFVGAHARRLERIGRRRAAAAPAAPPVRRQPLASAHVLALAHATPRALLDAPFDATLSALFAPPGVSSRCLPSAPRGRGGLAPIPP